MAGLFAITTTTNTVRLDEKRQGEVTFSVSNASERPMRGRALPQPEDPKAADWLRLEGEAERDFPEAGTERYTVTITVPEGAPPGSYALRLDMVNVKRPDEDYTRGQTITFEVPEAEPKKKPVPPWIALAAVGVILLVGFAVYMWPREVPNVVDLSIEEARVRLSDYGLQVGAIDSVYSDTMPGLIIESSPDAGTRVRRGQAVSLTISGGGQDVEFTLMGRGFNILDLYPSEGVIRDEDRYHGLHREARERLVQAMQEEWQEEFGHLRNFPDMPDVDLPEPPVDFAEEMIIAATREVKVMGFGPQFQQVQRFPERIVAQYTVTVVGDDCNGPPRDTDTFAIYETIRVPQSDLEVQFESRDVSRCPVQVSDLEGDILQVIRQLEDRGLGWSSEARWGEYDDVPAGDVLWVASGYEWVPPSEVVRLSISVGHDEVDDFIESHPFLLRREEGLGNLRLDTTAIRQALQR